MKKRSVLTEGVAPFRALAGVARATARAVRHRAQHFRRAEDGALIILGLIFFVMMLTVTGMAIDVMRYEAKRTQVQNTLDAATLAAANLDQSLNPKAVVQDYFAKAGLSQYLTGVTVTNGFGARKVQATADVKIPTYFMKLAGVPQLGGVSASTADESIGNVEISLVLDVSGSMTQRAWGDSRSKIDNLKIAADSFIDQMFAAVEPGKLSVSIVPYASQVTAGPKLFDYLNVTHDHDYSYCVDFKSSDFNTTSLDLSKATLQNAGLSALTTPPYQQTSPFDPFDYSAPPTPSRFVCPVEKERYILPFSSDPVALKAEIDNLQAYGNTSIDIGMKWGSALLDPSTQPILSDMVANGARPNALDGRPLSFTSGKTMKVIVVMTDGENTDRYSLNPRYATGPSPIWRGTTQSRWGTSYVFSVYSNAKKQYIDESTGRWSKQPAGSNAVQLAWPDVFNDMSLSYYDYNLRSDVLRYSNVASGSNSMVEDLQPQVMDSDLKRICSDAKQQGVKIYSIGFETSSHGRAVLQDCASDAGFYFDAKGIDIKTAFSSIASSINQLRLTQ